MAATSRSEARAGFDLAVRVRLLETDADNLETAVSTIKRNTTVAMLTTTTTAIALALNILLILGGAYR